MHAFQLTVRLYGIIAFIYCHASFPPSLSVYCGRTADTGRSRYVRLLWAGTRTQSTYTHTSFLMYRSWFNK